MVQKRVALQTVRCTWPLECGVFRHKARFDFLKSLQSRRDRTTVQTGPLRAGSAKIGIVPCSNRRVYACSQWLQQRAAHRSDVASAVSDRSATLQ